MKLWHCTYWDEDDSYGQFIVAETESHAREKWLRIIDEEYDYVFGENVYEVDVVEGFRIIVEPK